MPISKKQCPYCKEAVRSDAVKCRYCQSLLAGETVKEKEEPGSVIYILDKGLIRFGKFAALILVVFFGFGIYVFGFNLEKAADRLTNAREAIDKKMGEMNEAEKRLQI